MLQTRAGDPNGAGVAPRQFAKRGIAWSDERPSKFRAVAEEFSQQLFGGFDRDEYLQKRVHPKLQARATGLQDAELQELGLMDFSKQFAGIEVLSAEVRLDEELFGGASREDYMQQHIHRKLHRQVLSLSDRELLELGRLSFNEQFTVVEPVAETAAQRSAGQGPSAGLFGPGGREAFMQQRVHRKLHSKAATLSDQELLSLGALSFNEQFPALAAPGPGEQPAGPADLFGGASRDAYMAAHVHRRLHPQAAQLGDQQLRDLGLLSFNQQFTFLEATPPAAIVQPTAPDPFGGLGRDGYMQQRVHRRLHPLAATLGDQELLELGRLNFNDQFPALGQDGLVGQDGAAAPEATGMAPVPDLFQGGTMPVPDLFQGVGRDAYIVARVHRRLHLPAAQLSDEQLFELGQLSFTQQFTFFEGEPAPVAPQPDAADLFGGLGREGYMQQRVHRRLHPRAATLSDQELLELGRRSFNEQFPAVEQLRPTAASSPQGSDVFGGLGREAYMAQRVHRRLHAQAAQLGDLELLELGKLSFNQQFPIFEAGLPGELPASTDLFPQGREAYMQQRVHRKLHGQAAALADQELLELGKLSFNEQFPMLEVLVPSAQARFDQQCNLIV